MEYITQCRTKDLRDFKIGGWFINKVRFADDNARNLQDMVNRLVDTGRKFDMEINIDKSHVKRVSRSNESWHIEVNTRELK